MRLTHFPTHTTKETPADAELASHRLMLRSGMIRKLGSGLYSWMPMGLRALKRVEAIVREELNAAGAVEMLMPSVHPAELWQESGRWDVMGEEMLRMTDRHEREFCYGPTHEEVVCHHVRQDIRSYKQLPVNYYQIQTKFRDEVRPRFGVMRAREFLMKDAYSFHLDVASLDETYRAMRAAYQRIFDRIGVDYRIVAADSGAIGGQQSEEFHVLAGSGEDCLAVSDSGGYAANIEAAAAVAPERVADGSVGAMHEVDTPDQRTISDLARFLDVPAEACLKMIIVRGASDDEPLIGLLLRGDHELNEIKAEKHPRVASPLTMGSDDEITAAFGCAPGSLGPVKAPIPLLADHAALAMPRFVCGANMADRHLVDAVWDRDLPSPEGADLRTVVEGDPSPDGDGTLSLIRGIEVGHIFQLGDKYTKAMNVSVLDADGRDTTPQMGCYGIGVSRVVAAVIEQSHDDAGIIWPESIAPFRVIVIPINYGKSDRVREAADVLVAELEAAGIDTLVDDRGQRPGVMFADADLQGIPHRVVIGERGLDAGHYEYKHRNDADSRDIDSNVAAVFAALDGSG